MQSLLGGRHSIERPRTDFYFKPTYLSACLQRLLTLASFFWMHSRRRPCPAAPPAQYCFRSEKQRINLNSSRHFSQLLRRFRSLHFHDGQRKTTNSLLFRCFYLQSSAHVVDQPDGNVKASAPALIGSQRAFPSQKTRSLPGKPDGPRTPILRADHRSYSEHPQTKLLSVFVGVFPNL